LFVVPRRRANAGADRVACGSAGREAQRDDLMPPKPKLLPLLRWDIYKAAAKAKWIGEVEAPDADAAVELAAKEFNVQDAKKLLAVRRL